MMKIKFVATPIVTLMLVLAANLAFAQQTPSEASINDLLKVMNARAAIDNVVPQMQGMLRNSMTQALNGKTPTPEQQKIMDDMQVRLAKLYGEEMSWEKMRPVYMRIYQASFTQDEVNGMLTFYRSPSGQALVKKMPLVMQNTMGEMQKMMGPLMQKLQVAAREAQEKIVAERNATPSSGGGENKGTGPSSSPGTAPSTPPKK